MNEKELIDLIDRAKDGDELAFNKILKEKENVINSIPNKYFLPGGDIEDLKQFGRIGLYKGIKYYKQTSKANEFLNMCIKRQICSAIRDYTTIKHSFINKSLSTNTLIKSVEDNNELVIEDVLIHSDDTEEIILKKESELYVQSIIDKMEGMQKGILDLYLKGYSQREISIKLNLKTKQVDNALTRSKRRIKEILNIRKAC